MKTDDEIVDTKFFSILKLSLREVWRIENSENFEILEGSCLLRWKFLCILKRKKKWRMISLRYKYIATGVNSRNQAAIPQFVFELLEGLWHDNRRRETTRNCRLLELLIRIWSFPVHKQLNWRAAWMWRFPRKL